MNLGVIVCRGPDVNLTLSSILFGKYGDSTKQSVYVCQNWREGFAYAKNNFLLALFVDSGTVFSDWQNWCALLENYPHKGLIAHIIAHPGSSLYLDQQCWLMDMTKFEIDDLEQASRQFPKPVLSQQHMHDNYTPLYVEPGSSIIKEYQDKFGQGFIAKQLNNNLPVVNWNKATRNIKHYAYPDQRQQLISEIFKDYCEVAEQQLWVLNNEPVIIENVASLCLPGSGLYWLANAVNQTTTHMTVVDISKTQLDFCKFLWTCWDGKNYGRAAWEFIREHKIKHFQLDDAALTAKEKLDLLAENRFIDYVNNEFNSTMHKLNLTNFSDLWTKAKTSVNIEMLNDNLISFVSSSNKKFDRVWCSNILNYKWTLIHTTEQQMQYFYTKTHAT